MIQYTQYAETQGQRFFRSTHELPIVSAMIHVIAVALQQGNLESLSMTRLVVRGQERFPMKRATSARLGHARSFSFEKEGPSRQIENIYEGTQEEFDKIRAALGWYYSLCREFRIGNFSALESWPRSVLFPDETGEARDMPRPLHLLSANNDAFESIVGKIRTMQRQDIFNDNGMRRMAALCALLTFDVSLVRIAQMIEDASALETFAEKSAETLEIALALADEEPGIRVADIL